jgi:hypothetical protein
MMWVNITYSVDRGWPVSPSFSNLTYTLALQDSEETSIPVTVTVPPGASATDAAIFSAAFDQTNDMIFASGQTGNRTAQIQIRQVYSTAASFTNGMNTATATQGEDASFNVTVQNNGNGDAEYDAEVTNAGDLRPNDVVVEGTTPGVAPEGANVEIRVTLHANPAAIPGTYVVQIRVLATGAGEDPPAGAYADLTGTLNVETAEQPPSNNNTTEPPPPSNNNTTVPPGGNPPPPPDILSMFGVFITSPVGGMVAGIAALIAVILVISLRTHRKKVRKRKELLERARDRRRRVAAGASATPGKAAGPGPPARRGAVVRPVARSSAGPVSRPGTQDLKRRGPN